MKLSDVPPGELAKLGLDPYEDNARLKKIAIIVLLIHCAVVVVPLLVVTFISIFSEPEPEVIRATLVIPKGESLDVPADSDPEAGSPNPSEPTPEPEPPPAAPEPPEPEPEPAPEPAEPEPEPVPDTPPPPTVKSKIPPLEEVKEKPKPEEKKKPDPPKEKPKTKPKEKPKTRTAEDIRRDREKNKKNKNKTDKTAEKKNREAEIRQRRDAARAARAAAAAANARRQALQNAAGALNPNGKGKPGTPGKKFGTWDGKEGVVNTQAYVSYVDKLTALLRMRWKQPSSMEVGGKQLSVTLTLDIAADGTLKAKDFKPSGNKFMDQSVRELLNSLKVVPKPPCAMVQEVTLRVQDN